MRTFITIVVFLNINVEDAQTGISPRAELEKEIIYFEQQRAIVVNRLIRTYLNDSAFANPFDSVIAILEREKNAEMKIQLVSAYIIKATYTQARTLVDSLGQLQGFDNYASIQNFIIDMTESGTSFDTIFFDVALKNLVEGIANDTLKLGYLTARAIMRQVFGTYYPEHIDELPLGQQGQAKWSGKNFDIDTKMSDSDTPSTTEKDKPPFVIIYPNPAVNKITVEYHLPEKTSNSKIAFFNVLGISREYEITINNGKMYIDVALWNSGIYYYTVIVNNNTIARNKIVIIKK